jgi:hypothetical protein
MKITQVELRSGATVGVCWIEADRAEVGRVITLIRDARSWVVAKAYKSSTSEMVKGTLGFSG